jgi:hypothetical protein
MSSQQYIRVRNNTGRTIKAGAVTHVTKDYGVQTIPLNNLENGRETEPVQIVTGPSSRDYWWICWTTDGVNYVTLAERNAVHGHESVEKPGLITLRGLINDDVASSQLSVLFRTDDDTEDKATVLSPWT